ncbi:MAG: DinB family protein [Chitinophagaceae bacterium]|nr:DinB family protein [Chitinophagaceae bacterium]
MKEPLQNEYPLFFDSYIKLIRSKDIWAVLEEQISWFESAFTNGYQQQWNYRYDAEKWTVKQLVGHIIDAERVFVYRTLSFARGDSKNLNPFDENSFVIHGEFEKRTPSSLVEEMRYLRRSNIFFLSSIPEAYLDNEGTVNGNRITVRSLIYIIAGHFEHHRNILKERYSIY